MWFIAAQWFSPNFNRENAPHTIEIEIDFRWKIHIHSHCQRQCLCIVQITVSYIFHFDCKSIPFCWHTDFAVIIYYYSHIHSWHSSKKYSKMCWLHKALRKSQGRMLNFPSFSSASCCERNWPMSVVGATIKFSCDEYASSRRDVIVVFLPCRKNARKNHRQFNGHLKLFTQNFNAKWHEFNNEWNESARVKAIGSKVDFEVL